MAQKNNKRKEEVLEKIFRILFFSGLKKDGYCICLDYVFNLNTGEEINYEKYCII